MSNILKKKGVLLMYSYEGTNTYVDVYFQDETFWLTQAGMAELFDCAKSNISMHLKTIFAEEELDEATVMRKFRISELSTKPTNFYNLDAIIAVGYRVNSKKATRFRQWATRTLREYIQKGFVLNDEMMKNGRAFGRDYFDELLERIREIRASVCWRAREASLTRPPSKRSATSMPSSAKSRTRTMFRSLTVRPRNT